MQTRKTYFISDIHLCDDHPAILERFLTFLDSCDTTVDDLYILGDLFEAYIGDDNPSRCVSTVITALKKIATQGTKIHYLHGNRDFLIGKKFLRQSNCHLLQEETVINLYGKNVLLMHGDTLCTNDHAYMRARKILRNKFFLWFFLKAPLSFRMKVAGELRAKSKTHTQQNDYAIMDVEQSTVEQKMRAHHVNLLVHGHTHRPNIHTFMYNDQQMQRIVLGAWHDNISILSWHQDGSFELIEK